MLGKLIKYDVRSTYRTMLPFYAAAIIASIGLAISTNFENGVMAYVVRMIFGVILMTLMVMTISVTVQRFSKSVLGDEGYLMHTLPVTPAQLIISKLIVGFMWIVLSMLTVFFTVFMLLLGMGELGYFFEGLSQVIRAVFSDFTYVLEALLFVTNAFCGCMLFFAAVFFSQSVSQLPMFVKRRKLATFLTLLGVYILTQVTLSALIVPLIEDFFFTTSMPQHDAMALMLLISVGVLLVAFSLLFYGTNRILTRNLNLE